MSHAPDSVQRALALVAVAWGAGVGALGVVALPPSAASGLLVGGAAAVGIGTALALMAGRHARLAAVATERTLAETREMLQHRLSDHLHVLVRAAVAPDRELNDRERGRLAEVVGAAREVESTLELLSPASLEAWRRGR
ncbi:hypothetical protein BH23GEM11_BH23GEM11_03750 [soil metagenome]